MADDNKAFDLTKSTGFTAASMAACAAVGTLFAGPFGAVIGAGIGAILAGIAIIVRAVKSKKEANEEKNIPDGK